MCLSHTLAGFSLPSSGKLTNLLQAMCNVCAYKLGMLLLTTPQMGHISGSPFTDPFYFLPQISILLAQVSLHSHRTCLKDA